MSKGKSSKWWSDPSVQCEHSQQQPSWSDELADLSERSSCVAHNLSPHNKTNPWPHWLNGQSDSKNYTVTSSPNPKWVTLNQWQIHRSPWHQIGPTRPQARKCWHLHMFFDPRMQPDVWGVPISCCSPEITSSISNKIVVTFHGSKWNYKAFKGLFVSSSFPIMGTGQCAHTAQCPW